MKEMVLTEITAALDDLDYKIKSLYKLQDSIHPAVFKEDLDQLLNTRRRIGGLREAFLGRMVSKALDEGRSEIVDALNALEMKLDRITRRLDLLDSYLFGCADADIEEEKYREAVDEIAKEEDEQFIRHCEDCCCGSEECDCEDDEEEEDSFKCDCDICSPKDEEEEDENYFDED